MKLGQSTQTEPSHLNMLCSFHSTINYKISLQPWVYKSRVKWWQHFPLKSLGCFLLGGGLPVMSTAKGHTPDTPQDIGIGFSLKDKGAEGIGD